MPLRHTRRIEEPRIRTIVLAKWGDYRPVLPHAQLRFLARDAFLDAARTDQRVRDELAVGWFDDFEAEFREPVLADPTQEVVTVSTAIMREIYQLGVKPDWWKLAAPDDAAGWTLLDATIRDNDSWCRGVLLLGLEAPEADLIRQLTAAAGHPICKGFAVGRSIFGTAAEAWLAGTIGDDAAINQIASYYGRLIEAWQKSRREFANPKQLNPMQSVG